MSIWQGVRAATICGHTGDQAVTPGLVVALAICVCDPSPAVTTHVAGQPCDLPRCLLNDRFHNSSIGTTQPAEIPL